VADVIGSLAYKLKLDSQEFKVGMHATRAEFAAAKAIARDSATGLDNYNQALKNLDVLLQKKLIDDSKHSTAAKKLEQNYLQQEAAVRRLTVSEKERLNALGRGPDGKRSAQEMAEFHRMNREKGLAEQQRIKDQIDRYGKAVEAETAAARKGLQERLAIYKREKAARMDALAASARGPMQGPGFQNSNTFAGKPGDASSGGGVGGGLAFGAKAFAGAVVANEFMKAGAAAKQFVADSQEVFMANERNAASFEVFTGSAEKTRMLMEDMKQLAAVSGITLSAMASGASSMMAFGVATEDVTDKMKQMAAISRGDPERFKSLSLAYGQVTAAGKLMGQENLQLINAGFAPLAEISRTTGRSMAELRKDMENGLITTKMVADAFASATSEGGRFNGMLDKIGETTSGAQSKSKAAWDQAKNDVGEALAPLTRWRAEVSEFFAKDVSQLASVFKASAAVVEPEKVDPKAAGRQRLADETARRQRAEEKMAADREAARVSQAERLAQSQASESMKQIEQRTPAAEVDKFKNILGLLDESTKQTAIEDFAQNKNLEAIYTYLDKSLVAELKKLEAVEQQNKAYADQKSISENLKTEAEQLKEKYASSADNLKQQLVDLEVMRGRGMISNDVYDKARNDAAMTATADSRQKIDQANQLPTAIAQGSQEAYKLMVQNQNRAKTDTKKEAEKQIALAKQQVDVARESRDVLIKLSEQLDFEMVGG
jgi:tape measure domain-containing protein